MTNTPSFLAMIAKDPTPAAKTDSTSRPADDNGSHQAFEDFLDGAATPPPRDNVESSGKKDRPAKTATDKKSSDDCRKSKPAKDKAGDDAAAAGVVADSQKTQDLSDKKTQETGSQNPDAELAADIQGKCAVMIAKATEVLAAPVAQLKTSTGDSKKQPANPADVKPDSKTSAAIEALNATTVPLQTVGKPDSAPESAPDKTNLPAAALFARVQDKKASKEETALADALKASTPEAAKAGENGSKQEASQENANQDRSKADIRIPQDLLVKKQEESAAAKVAAALPAMGKKVVDPTAIAPAPLKPGLIFGSTVKEEAEITLTKTPSETLKDVGTQPALKMSMPEVLQEPVVAEVAAPGVQTANSLQTSGLPQEKTSLSNLVERVRQAVDSQIPPHPKQLSFELEPQSLGKVQLNMEWTAKGWSVQWSVTNRQVQDWIMNQLPALQQQPQNNSAPIVWQAPTLNDSSFDLARQQNQRYQGETYRDNYLPEETAAISEETSQKSNEYWA